MKQIFYIFLYLNIYTSIYYEVHTQNLTLSVEAEQTISEEFLDSLQFQKLYADYLSLKQEADSIPVKLQRMGFIESELKSLQKENDSSYVARYYFGKKYKYIKIFFVEGTFSSKDLNRISSEVTETYFILPFESIEIALRKLNAIQTENGNPFAALSLINISTEADASLRADLYSNQGSKRTIDSIAIKGYEKFPRSFLRYYAGIKTGKSFKQKKLIAQNEALNSLGFVNTEKSPEALFRKDSTIVYFYLKKQNNNLFDGILGFATDEETQKLQFNGYLNLELNNNLNFGEQLRINYKADGEDQVNFDTQLTLPYIFKSPFGLGAGLRIFKRDSTFITTDQQIKITYQINPPSNSYLGYKGYESSNLLNSVIAGTAIEDYTSRFLIAGVAYLKPQNYALFPIKTEIKLDFEAGTRRASTEEDQLRISEIINHIFNLNFRNSIFLQNSTSVLLSDTFLENELFRFGGINSIRGFDENSIDATLFSVLNTEYRYRFNEGVYVHSIIDLGYFENEALEIKQKLYSFGIGLGLKTAAGIFKFNVANGKSEDRSFNFSTTKIHLSLSSKF